MKAYIYGQGSIILETYLVGIFYTIVQRLELGRLDDTE
jgi:hypothetical protein